MKRILYVSVAFVLLVACSKGDEGSDFGFRSKKKQISNNWQVTEAIHLSGDSLRPFGDMYANYQLNICEDEQYSLSFRPGGLGSYAEAGRWKFTQNKTFIEFSSSNGEVYETEILKLGNNTLWIKYKNSGNEWELHMIPKS
jgi:hypothetical protein